MNSVCVQACLNPITSSRTQNWPKPHLPGPWTGPATGSLLLRCSDALGSLLRRSWAALGPLLGPLLDQFWTNFGSILGTCSQHALPDYFASIFDPPGTLKNIEKLMVFEHFCFFCKFALETNSGPDFGSILDPKSFQNRPQEGLQRCWKSYQFSEPFLNFLKSVFWPTWLQHGPFCPPRWPQVGPKLSQKSIQNRSKNGLRSEVGSGTDFGQILVRFWIDFGSIFGPILNRSWANFWSKSVWFYDPTAWHRMH